MTDYAKLIDAETRAFIERTNEWYPPDAVDRSIAEQRAVYDEMCRAFFTGYPQGVNARDSAVEAPGRAIPVRIYRTAAEPVVTLLYFHGGGFVLGGLESHDDVCAELAATTGYEVVAVDYRLAPEHTHPAQFDDALAAFEWATATRERPVLLCGDSAGGNIAAAVSHATRGHKRRPAGQVLIYPTLGGDQHRGSYVTHAEAPMLTTRDLGFYRDIRAGDRDVTGDITFAPLADADFANLPPTFVVTAECDPLSSDGEAYRDRILAAGGTAAWVEEKGLVHGFLRARHSVGRAKAGFRRIADALAALGRGEFPL